MKHYILVSKQHHYNLLSNIEFESSQHALEWGQKELERKGLDPCHCDNKLTVVSISNTQSLEVMDGEIGIGTKQKMRSYYCSYLENGELKSIDTPVLAKNKIFVEMTLMSNPAAFAYLDKAFAKVWSKGTKWRVRYDTIATVEVFKFPYMTGEHKRVVRYNNKSGELVSADYLSDLEFAAFQVLRYIKK
ncbi:hypothetical protein [Photobacterium leiognathi]|uniref:hypothetical protein n=1 Tax=Photobacterium leiognathi TaxID=553611 RepID=UPI00273970F3|nr:hypothetical protein [Photobacterium leiognathi]